MTNYRESLIDRMIAIYGFEHPTVVRFARMCEYWDNDKTLRIIVEAHEGNPGYWCNDNEEDE